jgi:hypothetical protein
MNALKCKSILAVALGLFACFGAGSMTHAATLVLVSLTCDEPEDANWDEPELVVSTRGELTSFFFPPMTRGQVQPREGEIGRVIMGRRTQVFLYDRDNGRTDWWDSDDLLGHQWVQPVVTNAGMMSFNRDGAFYTLRYRVIP